MNLNLGGVSGSELELGYTGAYTGAVESVDLTGSGVLTAQAQVSKPGAVGFVTGGDLQASAAVSRSASGAVTGALSAAADPSVDRPGSVGLVANGVLAGAGASDKAGAVTLSGSGVATASPSVVSQILSLGYVSSPGVLELGYMGVPVISYPYPAPYGLVDSNSMFAGQVLTEDTYWRFVTAFQHVTIDHTTGQAETPPYGNDINDHSTAEEGYEGSDTATIEVRYADGETDQFAVSATIESSVVIIEASVSAVATGTLTAIAKKAFSGAAAAVFASSLAATPTVDRSASVDLVTAGVLQGNSVTVTADSASVTLNTSGALAVAATADKTASGQFDTSLATTASPAVFRATSVGLDAVGILTASGTVVGGTDLSVSLTGQSQLSGDASSLVTRSADFDTSGALTAQPNVLTQVSGSFTGQSVLTGEATVAVAQSVSLTGQSQLSGSAITVTADSGSGSFSAQSQFTASPVRDAAGSGAVSGTSTLTAEAAVDRSVSVAISTEGALTGDPGRVTPGTAQLFGTGTLAGNAETGVFIPASGSMQATGSLTGLPNKVVDFSVSMQAQLQVTAVAPSDRVGVVAFHTTGVLSGETEGGTAVFRGYLYVRDVSIKPSMSCYTKLEPSLVAGTVTVKPPQ